MAQDKSIEILDYLIILLKKKFFLITLFFTILIASYLAIYFFVDEQFDSTALIIPSEQDESGFSSILKGISDLPLAGLGGVKKSGGMDIYNTLIYSRSNLEKIVNKFNLIEEYESKNIEEAVKTLKSKISTDEESETAFLITVRGSTPEKSAEMTNYVVESLNHNVIELNISKSRSNRIFLEQRYSDIKSLLKNAEDSLRLYQEKSGVFEAKEQVKATIQAYSEFESKLAVKQIELSVNEKLFGKESPQFMNTKIAVDEFQSKLNNLRQGGGSNDMVLSMHSLPVKALDYFRLFRDVEIYSAMLEFIIPMFEQAKFAEQKEVPILQVIDYAVPPIKRAYPKRTISALIIALIITLFASLYILIKEIIRLSDNPKMQHVRQQLYLRRNREI